MIKKIVKKEKKVKKKKEIKKKELKLTEEEIEVLKKSRFAEILLKMID